MKVTIRVILLLIIPLIPIDDLLSQETYQSPFFEDAQPLIDFAEDCADFWEGASDTLYGGYFTDVDRSGNILNSNKKGMVSHSRNAYGFAKVFMLTGDIHYLTLAQQSLDFMYQHMWDSIYGGWYDETNRQGKNPSTGIKTAFNQHYGLLGPIAMFEATGDSIHWQQIEKGSSFIEEFLWDDNNQQYGYFDQVSRNGNNGKGKSFNATVDAITAYLWPLYLLTEDEKYMNRLDQIKINIEQHFLRHMPSQRIGFPESFNSDWSIDGNQTRTIMGHVLKTGWCMARINRMEDNEETLDASKAFVQNVLDKGYDHELGGPHKDYNRLTGQMLMYGASDIAKAWWQMEQAITSGFLLFETTWEVKYLKMAIESLDFYMEYFVDPIYGEVYADRSRDGGRVRYSGGFWDENKGSKGKAGYHSIETAYYSYVYIKLLVMQEPVTLYYKYEAGENSRTLKMNPIAVDFEKLSISSVVKDGESYTDFDADSRLLNLPANTEGIFAVTYRMNDLPDLPQIVLSSLNPKRKVAIQLYPNPVREEINLILPKSFTADHISIYNSLGVLNKRIPFTKSIATTNLPRGIYFIRAHNDVEYFQSGFVIY